MDIHKNVLITGGTGMIGSRLTPMLQEKGYQVSHLSRSRKGNETVKTYLWDIQKQEIEPEALQQADYIVHLAGASLADQRWTESRKKLIIKSRTDSTRLLHDTIAQLGEHQIKAFVSASGISIYGSDTGSTEMFENSPKGNEFIVDVVKQWEASVDEIKRLNIRTVKLRTGIVLSMEGGALAKIVQPIKFGVGAPLGNGQQYMSWIHIDDICRMFIHALENEEVNDVYNAVAPRPVTNEELTQSAAKILHKPLFIPKVPAFALRLVFGEMASIVLGGNKVSGQKIQKTGFDFKYKRIDAALADLLK
ncbi:TIGR01777 family oxidoreductase [Catalinimonas niigatensis]|uniref:TIGR01777 family oxidoreductase n=1 Tax=Catalinimonas niigatensis TaxID=1397264 RepID=UPI002666CA06|nr:TIGR01777 family oxidoreductase [Catalinimonas niigatensis]WPP53157.1 TIGR01777 family oxidoreductase [Catalinimonas niigatensis]